MMRRTIVSILACGALAITTGVAGAWQPTATATSKAKVGEKAPTFMLTDTEGKEHDLAKYTEEKKIVVLEWFNPDCPWVVKHHDEYNLIEDTQKKFKDKGVVWLAINSGAAGEQGTGKDHNNEMKRQFEMAYPVLLDESGKVGKAYGAKTTPHMYIIDAEGVLRYMGAPDDFKESGELCQRNLLEEALTAILAGETIEVTESQSYGCNVKYSKN